MSEATGVVMMMASDERSMTWGELCRRCGVAGDQLLDMVEEGLLQPQGSDPRCCRFTLAELHRVRSAVHLQRDLGVNLPGAVLALELMDEMQRLRSRLRLLEKMLG